METNEEWEKRIKCKLAYYRKCSYNPENCDKIECVYHKLHI